MTSRYSSISISGGRPLCGTVTVTGFKHSLVLTVAFLLGKGGPVRLSNVPDLVEVEVFEQLLPAIGVKDFRRDDNQLSWSGIEHDGGVIRLPPIADQIHGSLYLLPCLVASRRPVLFAGFGGCKIGDGPQGQRPWRHAVDVLCRYGAQFYETEEGPVIHAPAGLKGADIDLLDFTLDRRLATGPEYSGATKTAALAAVLAEGASCLRHPYGKAEIRSLIELFEAAGVRVEQGAEELVLEARASSKTASSEMPTAMLDVLVPPDLLEVATWISVVGVAGGRLEIRGITAELLRRDLPHEASIWRALGIDIESNGCGDGVVVTAPASGELAPMPNVDVRPAGVYSDSHPLLAVLATRCLGVVTITDRVWVNRYAYATGLKQMGVNATIDEGGIHIPGTADLTEPATPLVATDLRCAAAYLLAALRVAGPTTIANAHHLRRGYDGLVEKLSQIGVQVVAND